MVGFALENVLIGYGVYHHTHNHQAPTCTNTHTHIPLLCTDAGEENDDNDDDDEAGHSSARSAAMVRCMLCFILYILYILCVSRYIVCVFKLCCVCLCDTHTHTHTTTNTQTQARRKTYPAGRILHLIPAYLLLGEEALFEEYGGGPGTRGSMHSTSMTHNTTSATHNNTSATHNTSSSAHHASISHNTAGGCDGIHTTTRIVAGEYADYHADTDPTTTTTNTMDAHQHANTTPHKHTSHTSTAPTHPPAMSPAPSLGGGGPSQTLGGGPAGSPAPSLGGGMPSLAAHIVGSPPRVFSGSVRGGGGGGLLSDEEGEEHVYSRSGSMRPEATSSKVCELMGFVWCALICCVCVCVCMHVYLCSRVWANRIHNSIAIHVQEAINTRTHSTTHSLSLSHTHSTTHTLYNNTTGTERQAYSVHADGPCAA